MTTTVQPMFHEKSPEGPSASSSKFGQIVATTSGELQKNACEHSHKAVIQTTVHFHLLIKNERSIIFFNIS